MLPPVVLNVPAYYDWGSPQRTDFLVFDMQIIFQLVRCPRAASQAVQLRDKPLTSDSLCKRRRTPYQRRRRFDGCQSHIQRELEIRKIRKPLLACIWPRAVSLAQNKRIWDVIKWSLLAFQSLFKRFRPNQLILCLVSMLLNHFRDDGIHVL